MDDHSFKLKLSNLIFNDVNINFRMVRFGLQSHILTFNYNDTKAINNFFLFTLTINTQDL